LRERKAQIQDIVRASLPCVPYPGPNHP
jgi:hypothetical protein